MIKYLMGILQRTVIIEARSVEGFYRVAEMVAAKGGYSLFENRRNLAGGLRR